MRLRIDKVFVKVLLHLSCITCDNISSFSQGRVATCLRYGGYIVTFMLEI